MISPMRLIAGESNKMNFSTVPYASLSRVNSVSSAQSCAQSVSPDEAEQGQSTVPRMVGEAEGVAVVNRR